METEYNASFSVWTPRASTSPQLSPRATLTQPLTVGVVVPGLYSNVAENLDDYDVRARTMLRNVQKHAPGEGVAIVSYLVTRRPRTLQR